MQATLVRPKKKKTQRNATPPQIRNIDLEVVDRALQISRYNDYLNRKSLYTKGLQKISRALFKPVVVDFETVQFSIKE